MELEEKDDGAAAMIDMKTILFSTAILFSTQVAARIIRLGVALKKRCPR